MELVIAYGDGEMEVPADIIAEERAFRMTDRHIKSSLRPEDEDRETLFYMCLRRVAPHTFTRVIEGRSVIT